MAEKPNFLVPIDFHQESGIALEYAVSVGKEINATIHLVHIIEEESPMYRMVIKDEQRDMILRGAKDKLDDLAGKIVGPSRLNFTTGIKQGKIYNKIIEAAAEVKANIIFMGRTDSSDVKKNITGTNTMHIIKEANIPVITLRKKPEFQGCSHIILPLDLSKQTIVKASNAIALAKLFSAKITIVSLIHEKLKSIEIKHTKRLDSIRGTFEKLDVECGFRILTGKEKDASGILNKLAHEIQGNLIMIMTQQEMNITEYFVGSLAQEIINKSDYPVLSINPLSGEKSGIPIPGSNVFIDPIQMLDH